MPASCARGARRSGRMADVRGGKSKLQRHYDAAVARGDLAAAKVTALAMARGSPKSAEPWGMAAACALHCEQWDEAIRHAMNAVRFGARRPVAYDVLAHAHGAR